MKTLGVRELTERINEILKLLEAGEIIELTNDGEVIGHLTPKYRAEQTVKQDHNTFWANIDHLAAEIGSHLPNESVDAVEIVRDVRREL